VNGSRRICEIAVNKYLLPFAQKVLPKRHESESKSLKRS
jgi:hypothetical protein